MKEDDGDRVHDTGKITSGHSSFIPRMQCGWGGWGKHRREKDTVPLQFFLIPFLTPNPSSPISGQGP